MSIGAGIAIAGVWVMVGMLGMAKQVTPIGFLVGVAVALAVTVAALVGVN